MIKWLLSLFSKPSKPNRRSSERARREARHTIEREIADVRKAQENQRRQNRG